MSSALLWVTTVARLLLAGVLIVAGWGKIGTPVLSVQAVKAYELLPYSLATVVGYGLPILEIVLGVLLIVGLLTRVAGVVSALLMLAFVIGIASAWARGLRIDCGCFGGGGPLKAGVEPNYLFDIVRDFGFFVLGVLDRLVRTRTIRAGLRAGAGPRAGAIRRASRMTRRSPMKRRTTDGQGRAGSVGA